ncbi:MAG: HemK/PrmC family methyltransferase, partial [Candidatus Humimicrobiaceae bacterium]
GRLAKNRDKVEILEVGVGSGAISLSILFELKGLNYNILATDNSEQAIRVAQKNADNILGKEELERIKFSLCDILPEESGKFDLVISNPPYITVNDYEGLPKEVKDYEPKHALLAGETGREVYGQIMEKAGVEINSGGYMIFEIDPGLAKSLRKLAEDRLSAKNISVYQDYNGRDRILTIEV